MSKLDREKQFLHAFDLAKPYIAVRVYDNDIDSHYNDYTDIEYSFESKNITKSVDEVNKLIQDGFAEPKYTKAFYKYPSVDGDKILKLICLLSTEVYSYVTLSCETVKLLKDEMFEEFIDFIDSRYTHPKKKEKIKRKVQEIFGVV